MCKLSPEECNLSKLPAVGASRESSWMLHWISKATTETVPQLHHPKVGLFNPNSGSPWQPTILSFSLGLCPMGTPCPDCRTEGPGSHPRALSKLTRITSWQTSNCHLVSAAWEVYLGSDWFPNFQMVRSGIVKLWSWAFFFLIHLHVI